MSLPLFESSQYDELWPDVHLSPEQTVQADIEIKAQLIVPIHWGDFTLANHSWINQVVRTSREAERFNVDLATPRISETIWLDRPDYPKSRWWEKYL